MQEQAERDLMAREEVVSMAIEQVTRSDSVLQAKLVALKRDRIRAEAGEYCCVCLLALFLSGELCPCDISVTGLLHRGLGRSPLCI
jgi:hypothetical protein